MIENRDLLAQYLLGELSGADREQLEHACFTNDEMSDLLDEVETDIIDSYVCNALPSHQRGQFEKYFLNLPGKRQRVELARTLMSEAKAEKFMSGSGRKEHESGSFTQRQVLFKSILPTAVAATIAIVAILLAIQNHRLRQEFQKIEAARAISQDRTRDLEQQIAMLKEGNANATRGTLFLPFASVPTMYIPLAAHSLRDVNGKDRQVFSLSRLPASVVLVLGLHHDDFSRYSALFQSVEKNELDRTNGLTSQAARDAGKIIAVPLPSRLLKKGDYIIQLFGQTATGRQQLIDSYSFSVRR